MSASNRRIKWTQKEDSILKNLVKNLGIKKWQQISEQLKQLSKNDDKTPQKCKQRWTKYLSPKVNKSQWRDQQVKIIFERHRIQGSKWTQIARSLQHRSDNDVKNHFYNALRKGIRKICKLLQVQKSTDKVKKLKPKQLSNKIYQTANSKSKQNQEVKQHIYDILFEFSRDDNTQQLKKKVSANEGFKQLLTKIKELLNIQNKRDSKGNSSRDNRTKQVLQSQQSEEEEEEEEEASEQLYKQSKQNKKEKNVRYQQKQTRKKVKKEQAQKQQVEKHQKIDLQNSNKMVNSNKKQSRSRMKQSVNTKNLANQIIQGFNQESENIDNIDINDHNTFRQQFNNQVNTNIQFNNPVNSNIQIAKILQSSNNFGFRNVGFISNFYQSNNSLYFGSCQNIARYQNSNQNGTL